MITMHTKQRTNLVAALTALSLMTCAAPAQVVDLASFGSATFAIDPISSTVIPTQTASGLTFSPSINFGDSVGGEFAPPAFNWSAYNPSTPGVIWYAKISILSGSNPNLPFTLNLIDTVAGTSLNFDGFTTGATSNSYVTLSLNPTDPGTASVLSGVNFAQITWNNGGTADISVQNVSAVPEPSTYVLLALSSLALGGYVARRRKRG
jgi:hypothetical protein